MLKLKLFEILPKDDEQELKLMKETFSKNQQNYKAVFCAKDRAGCPDNLTMQDLYAAIMQTFQPPANHDYNVISTEIDKKEQRAFLNEKADELSTKGIITSAEKEILLREFDSKLKTIAETRPSLKIS